MRVPECVNEFTRLQACNLGDHHRQQCIRSDVEWNTEENVSRSLIKLARELPVGHMKLEEAVAWWQGHCIHLGRIPCGDDQPAGVWVAPDLFNDICDLID